MRFARKLSVALITTGLGGAMPPLAAQAISVQTVQDPVPSGSEPVRGRGLTINVGSIPPDALIPPTVQLDLVGFRMGDNGIGSADRPAVYLHVCDDFGLNGDGTANRGAIGSLLAVSTNTLNLETPAPSTDLISTFAGPTLNKGPTYHYVMANNTTAATSGDFSNLIYRDLEVAFANPPTGGQAYVQTGDEPSPDLYFRVLSSFDSVPERWTSAPALGGLLMLGWITWRQKGV